jgi:four helix bundle protein
MTIQNYKDLIVWQKAIKLALEVYKLTDKFPKSEIFGSVNQMRRSAFSIPSNIAEGWARKYSGEFLQFLSVASGSAAELETQLMITQKLGYGDLASYEKIQSLLTEVQKMLNSFRSKIKKGVTSH